jgi:hypothetical protein
MRLSDAIAQNTLPKGPNCQLASQSSTSLRHFSQERNFSTQRQGRELGTFSAISVAETAFRREFNRHVFETATLLRVFSMLYNLGVWMVGATGIEPVTPSMSTRCSPAELRAPRFT